VPGGQLGLDPRTYGAATIYYFRRDHFDGVSGYITPGQRLSHHVWIVIPRDQPNLPAFAAQVARSLGGTVPAAPAPRLVRRWTYVAVYDVPLSG
jgi:hypothetical protein